MAKQYDNTNRGALFDNNRKERDSQPDMTGKIDIDGVEHFISGWWKDGRGGRYLSLAKQTRNADGKGGQGQGGQGGQQRSGPPRQQSKPAFDNIGKPMQDEDIPF